MRVFVTGASGHIGSAVVPELLGAGHQVVGLARSDGSAAALEAAGAEVHRCTLEDLDGLRDAAAAADGVIHLAFDHAAMRSGRFEDAIASNQRAIETIAAALEGSGKPFVGTSGTLMLTLGGISGRSGTEEDAIESGPRVESENFVVGLGERGVRSSVVRLPPIVHSTLDHHGFAPTLIAIARNTGVAGYVGDGSNRWPSVNTFDAARVYRLALEEAPAGSRLHAVAEEGVPFREIAEVIGRKLEVPAASIPADDAEEHFSFLAAFVGLDNPTSSEFTRRLLNWQPTQPGLLADLDQGHYFEAALVS
ncbi:MAG TPA: SDR family oxidoreductase [Solirubrobacteraceae bacterium]|nr:SDR family oxidoreductase [Solirubrobacteraceae bacterium]